MSILIRTGLGRTDLSYTDAAVKNLKVLQKTGNKSVKWITTAAGTTYQNILQKRGTKDLFYGSITIPADVPSWAVDPKSGGIVKYPGYLNPSLINDYGTGSIRISVYQSGIVSTSPFFGIVGGSNPPLTDIIGTVGNTDTASGIAIDWEVDSAYFYCAFPPDIKKIFMVSNSEPTKKLVALVTHSRTEEKSGDKGYYFYYTVRNVFNSIGTPSGQYTIGIRSSDT